MVRRGVDRRKKNPKRSEGEVPKEAQDIQLDETVGDLKRERQQGRLPLQR